MKLNVLLGDAYKEGMTADEIISALEKVADPSRSGDLDAGILQYLMNKYGMNIDEMLNILNKKSGVEGLSGVSSDFRQKLAGIPCLFPDLLQMRKDLTGKRISTGSFHAPPVFLPDPALHGAGETIMAALTTRSRNQTVCWIYPGRSTIC